MHSPSRNLPACLIGLVIGLCLLTITPTTSHAAIQVDYHWAPSPPLSTQGEVLPPAVAYEVWLTVDHGVEEMIATVSDTAYTLSADPGKTYNLSVCGISADGKRGPMSQTSEDYAIWPISAVASETTAGLGSAHPNPFNPRTAITFHVPENVTDSTPLSLDIFDMRGRLVHRLTPDRSPGVHSVVWNGVDVQGAAMPSGIYVARYICGAATATLKMTLVR